MTANTCNCGQPTDAYACPDCIDRLGRALGDVPALSEELDLTLSRQRRFAANTGGSRDAETPLAFNLAASNATGNLRSMLVSWVRLCDEEHVRSTDPNRELPDNTLVAMSRWLLWRTDGLALHPAGGDAVDELTDAVAECERVVDRPPERAYAGPCQVCGVDLYATSGKSKVTCEGCGMTYDLAERREWMLAKIPDMLATATEIARALTSLAVPVTAERVRTWKAEKRLTAKAHTVNGHALFRVGDVQELAVADLAKRRQSAVS